MMQEFTKKRNRFTRGFTLVETLVAISIFSLSILGMLSVLASGLTSTTYAKNKTIASYLAQEGIEFLRNTRDTFVISDVDNQVNPQTDWINFATDMLGCTPSNPCGFDETVPDTGDFCSNYTSVCKLYVLNGVYNITEPTGSVFSGFTRTVWAIKPKPINNPDEIIIYSKVSWMQGSTPYNVTFSEDLFNWVE